MIIRRLFRYYIKYLPRVILGIFAIVLLTQCDIFNAFVVKELTNVFSQIGTQLAKNEALKYTLSYKQIKLYYEFIGQNQIFKFIIMITIAVLINMTLKGLFVYIKEYSLNSAILKSLRDVRQDLYKRIIRFPMKFYDFNKTGDMMAKITNDVSMIEGTFNSFNNIVTDLIQSLFFLTLMVILNWKLSLLILLMFPITGYVLKKFAIPIRKAQKKIVENISHITSFLQETLSGIKVIKIFNKEDTEKNKFNSLTQATYARNMKSVRLIALQKPINELLSIIGVIIIILYSGYQMINGHITIADFIQYIVIANMVYKPLKGIGKINAAIQKAYAAGTRIFELLDNETEQDFKVKYKKLMHIKEIKGEVQFKNVRFEYKKKSPILNNVNFKAKPGEVIALVGHSGSGKTTIVNLVPRFYNIINGTILIDGIDLNRIESHSLREFIGMVPQDTFLFSGTIKENIAYAKENATFEEIKQAAKLANAHKFISRLKKGYDTEVGEKGVQLSGGEKQRISIARAILKDPKILILDEATSALDTQSEILVQQALNYLMKNRTTFVIAHRLSTIKNADKILVIKNGEIIQMGTHNQLMKKKKGVYFQLCNAQNLFK